MAPTCLWRYYPPFAISTQKPLICLTSNKVTIKPYKTKNKGHGRKEKRVCTVLTPKEGKNFGINP